MRIMVDIDNTLADYTHALRYWLRGTHVYGPLNEYAMAEPCEYGLWRDPSWPFSSYEEYADAHHAAVLDGLYAAEHPYPHAMRALWQLVEDGHDLVVATSRVDDEHFQQTFAWFTRHWHDPAHGPVEYGVGFHFGDKTLLDVDAAFEDDPAVIDELAAKGVTVIHPDHPYCRDGGGITMSDWRQAPGIIRQLQEDKERHRDQRVPTARPAATHHGRMRPVGTGTHQPGRPVHRRVSGCVGADRIVLRPPRQEHVETLTYQHIYKEHDD